MGEGEAAGDADAAGDALAEPDGLGDAEALGEPDAVGDEYGLGDDVPPPLQAARHAIKTHHIGRMRSGYGGAQAVPLDARAEIGHTSSASPPR